MVLSLNESNENLINISMVSGRINVLTSNRTQRLIIFSERETRFCRKFIHRMYIHSGVWVVVEYEKKKKKNNQQAEKEVGLYRTEVS